MEKHVVAFRDFRSSSHWNPAADGIDAALVKANEWLADSGITPLSVETIRELTGSREALASVERGIRIWYTAGLAAGRVGSS